MPNEYRHHYLTRIDHWFDLKTMNVPDNHWLYKPWDAFDMVKKYIPHKHRVVDDQCYKPEHRYCVLCSKTLPNRKVTE